MIFQTTIPVTKKSAPKNKYKITVEAMHGDADMDTTETRIFEANEEGISKMIDTIRILCSYWNVSGYPEDETIDEQIYKTCLDHNISNKYPTDTYMDIVGNDRTNDGQTYASLQEISVTYFDISGIEHHVEIEIDGKITKILNAGFFGSHY